jgi:hypothetical protein
VQGHTVTRALTTACALLCLACTRHEPDTAVTVAASSLKVTTTPSTGRPNAKATHSTTESPATITKSKKLDGIDSCSLLRPGDLEFLGGAAGPPLHDVIIPTSCAYQLGGGAEQDKALIGLFKPMDQVRTQQPHGEHYDTNGYNTWLTCSVDNGYETCTAALAVRKERTLVTIVSKRDTPKDTIIDALHQLTLQALDRLPDDPAG